MMKYTSQGSHLYRMRAAIPWASSLSSLTLLAHVILNGRGNNSADHSVTARIKYDNGNKALSPNTSTIVSYYYFIKETMMEELPSLSHLCPLLPPRKASFSYITLLRFPTLGRKQAQGWRGAASPVAPSQTYSNRMVWLPYDSMRNFLWIRKPPTLS